MIDFKSIEVGLELEPLVKPPIDKKLLVQYCGVAQDFHLIHTDDETARQDGLPGVVAHGMLGMGYIGQQLGRLVGPRGFVQRLQVKFTGIVFPGDVLTCHAKVVDKDELKRTVDLEVAASTESGKIVTRGEATLKFYE